MVPLARPQKEIMYYLKLMKGDPCYKIADLAELCFVGWKVKLVCNEIAYLAELTKC